MRHKGPPSLARWWSNATLTYQSRGACNVCCHSVGASCGVGLQVDTHNGHGVHRGAVSCVQLLQRGPAQVLAQTIELWSRVDSEVVLSQGAIREHDDAVNGLVGMLCKGGGDNTRMS